MSTDQTMTVPVDTPSTTDQATAAGADGDLPEVPATRRTLRDRLAAHPVLTGAAAAVLSAGLAFGGGYLVGSAGTADPTAVIGTGEGTFPGGVAPGSERPGMPPGRDGTVPDGTVPDGTTQDGTTDGGVSDGSAADA